MGRKHVLRLNYLVGTLFGLCFGVLLSSWCRQRILPCLPMKGTCCFHVNYHVNIVEHIQIQNDNVLHLKKRSQSGLDLSEYIDKNEKGFLLIGVITAKKFLDTRAVAAFNTWTSSCVGTCKVLFFSSEGSTTSHDIPLISLRDVDDSYPPQKKSLMMLKYMHDHYIENFEWFMRADDDVFVKGDKMEKFLRSVNSSMPQFLGQAGIGMKNELGKKEYCLNAHLI